MYFHPAGLTFCFVFFFFTLEFVQTEEHSFKAVFPKYETWSYLC